MLFAARCTAIVASREILERVRSRVFWAILALTVVSIIGGAHAVGSLTSDTDQFSVVVANDSPSTLETELQTSAALYGLTLSTMSAPPRDVPGLLLEGLAQAAVVDGQDIVIAGPVAPALITAIADAVDATARQGIATRVGVAEPDLELLIDPVVTTVKDLRSSDATAGKPLPALAASFLLLMSLLIFGLLVGSGVAEEKQNRIAEVLLSKLPAQALLAGKVLGIGAVGLFQVTAVAVSGLLALRTAQSGNPAAQSFAGLDMIDGFWLLLWFVQGFILYSLVYATLGATVSRQEDFQSLVYIPMLIILPAYVILAANFDDWSSNSWLAPASFVPFWTPILMPFRLATESASTGEALLALLGTVAASLGLIWLGSQVYLGNILRTGSRVPLSEALLSAFERSR